MLMATGIVAGRPIGAARASVERRRLGLEGAVQ